MPRYTYKCTSCNEIYDLTHSYKEEVLTCAFDKCDGKPEKVLTPVRYLKKQKNELKAGDLVKKAINDIKKDLKTPAKRKDYKE